MDTKIINTRFDAAAQERKRLEPLFDDAMRLTMPARPRFAKTSQADRADDIFDETGANAVQEFMSRMQAGITPPFTNFVELEASSLVDPKDRKAINTDLDQINQYVFEEIWRSNFAQESAECYLDLALSTATLSVEDGPDGKLIHRAVPITDVFHERGANDQIGGTFRSASVKARDLTDRYPRAEIQNGSPLHRIIAAEADRDLEVVEYVRKIPGAIERTEYHVMVREVNEIIERRAMTGHGSSPLLPFRWSSAAGETWGRGPLLNGLGAIRTTNLMVEMVLENAAMSIVGIYQTDNEGTINAENMSLLPGTILSKDVGTNGLEPIHGASGNFNMQDVVLSDQRLNIKRALYNDMLSDPNKTPATATEVVERMADLAHRTSAGFSRVFYEFVQPYMWRVIRLLEQRGDIEMPTQNGRAVTFRAVSPLAQAQHGRELQLLMQEFQIKAQILGPQAAMASYKMDKLLPWIQARTGLSEEIYASPEEVVKAMQRQAEAIQQAQAQQQQPANAA